MSRLIDADVFIEYLGLNAENSREENLGEIVTLEDFDAQPTAYDVDKVVKQLEELKKTAYECYGRASGAHVAMCNAIEIVKGGVEE